MDIGARKVSIFDLPVSNLGRGAGRKAGSGYAMLNRLYPIDAYMRHTTFSACDVTSGNVLGT